MADFPNTGLLEDFVYSPSSENPLSHGGRWGSYFTRPPLRKVGAHANPTVEFAVNGSYWTPDVFIGDAEAWGCVSGGGLGAANESWRVALWKDDPNQMVGYSSGFGGGISENYFFRRYDGGGSYFELSQVGATPPEKLGIRVTATSVQQWAYYSGDWHLIDEKPDTTYRGAFYASIELEEQGGIDELSFDCFGAGVKNRQHFYRWVKADHRD